MKLMTHQNDAQASFPKDLSTVQRKQSSGKRRRLAPDEILELMPQRLGGQPKRNLRTRYAEVEDRVITANEGARLYLTLSNKHETWTKEATADALEELADQRPFDPVLDYLMQLSCEPLSEEQWLRLDQLFFNIDDPVAAAFMPRYLIACVARVYEPGCLVRQVPTCVGPQQIGKTELGRALFGPDFYGDGLTSKLDVDDVTRLTRVWALELGELDGITRKTQVEHLKAFLSRRVDYDRRKYGHGTESIPRRSVFWATSNGAPLRDPSGSTRFVVIRLPHAQLPIERVAMLRNSIWKKALECYHAGDQWYSTNQEMDAISERNSDYVQVDPWGEKISPLVERWVESGSFPIPTYAIYNHLEIPVERQNQANANRIRQVMESLGMAYAQRRNAKGQPVRGYWM